MVYNDCVWMSLILVSSFKYITGQDTCKEVLHAATSTCNTRGDQCQNIPESFKCEGGTTLVAFPPEVHVLNPTECLNVTAYLTSVNTMQNDCTYTYFSENYLNLTDGTICNANKTINSTLCGNSLIVKKIVYCIPFDPDLFPIDPEVSLVTTVFGHSELVLDPDKAEEVSNAMFVVIASHPDIVLFVDNNNIQPEIYNLTALQCIVTISVNYQVLLGGSGFKMSAMEDQEESCLVISDSLTPGSNSFYFCNNNTQEDPLKHVILPCHDEIRTAQISFRGLNNTWFVLPVTGLDKDAFKLTCSVGIPKTEEVSTTESWTTVVSTSTAEGDIVSSDTTSHTATNSPGKIQATTLSTPDNSDSSLIIIIVCVLGGLLLIVLLTIVVICCYNKRKKANSRRETNHAVDNPVYGEEPTDLARYASHIEPRTGYRGQAAIEGNLYNEDKVYQVDVDMPSDGKKFDIQQRTAVLTDPSGLYAVPNLSAKKSRRTNISAATSDRQSDLGSLGWDNSGTSNGGYKGFNGEAMEMMDNVLYAGGDPD